MELAARNGSPAVEPFRAAIFFTDERPKAVLNFKEALIVGCALWNSPFFLKATTAMKAKKALLASSSTGASSSSAAAATEEELRGQRRNARLARAKKAMKAKKAKKVKKASLASSSTGASSSSAAAATEEELREQHRDARLARARRMSAGELGEELLIAWEAIASLENEVSTLRQGMVDLRSLLAEHLGDGIADLRFVVESLRRT
jgi:hypothetical protein